MSEEKLPPPILVTKPRQLEHLVEKLAQQPIVAVDTESNSLYAYQEQVCLLQFSIPRADYLVDPLVLLDLEPLRPIFADPGIEKVFHAAEYDVICLKRDFGFSFGGLFDTMVGARILGRKAVGLGNMLKSEFGVKLEKRYQRANWGQRPLPDHLLSYARLDTHYLIELRNRLAAELAASNRMALAQEDFERLTAVNGKLEHSSLDEDTFRHSKELTPQQNAVLFELHKFRDRLARQKDRPLFKIFGDKTLHAIAETCPADLEALGRLPGMSNRQVRRYGEQLLKIVQVGMARAPLKPKRRPRPNAQMLQRLETLRNWRKRAARSMKVESDVVLPRDLMVELAENNPGCREDLVEVLEEVPWRLERFGDQIMNVLQSSH